MSIYSASCRSLRFDYTKWNFLYFALTTPTTQRTYGSFAFRICLIWVWTGHAHTKKPSLEIWLYLEDYRIIAYEYVLWLKRTYTHTHKSTIQACVQGTMKFATNLHIDRIGDVLSWCVLGLWRARARKHFPYTKSILLLLLLLLYSYV